MAGPYLRTLDVRAAAHTVSTPRAADARESSSLEWAVSFAASVAVHLVRAGRDTTVVAGTTVIRPNGSHDTVVEDELAVLAATSDLDLIRTVNTARQAGQDSAIIAVLAPLDPASIHAVSELRPRGSRSAAFAVVLDTPTWAPRVAGRTTTLLSPAATVDALRTAGWWVALARQGDETPAIWAALLEQSSARTLGDARS